MNKGFTSEDLRILQKHPLPLQSNVFIDTLKDEDVVGRVLEKLADINKELGREKGHLSTTKPARKKIKVK